jgi:hypothetical protein
MEDSLTRACRKNDPSIIFRELPITKQEAIEIINYSGRTKDSCLSYNDKSKRTLRDACVGLSCNECMLNMQHCTVESMIRWINGGTYVSSKTKVVSSSTRNKYFPKLTDL